MSTSMMKCAGFAIFDFRFDTHAAIETALGAFRHPVSRPIRRPYCLSEICLNQSAAERFSAS